MDQGSTHNDNQSVSGVPTEAIPAAPSHETSSGERISTEINAADGSNLVGASSPAVYATYLEYVSSIEARWPEYRPFREFLQKQKDEGVVLQTQFVEVIDVSSAGKLSHKRYGEDFDYLPELERLSETLNEAPEDMKTRIIVVDNNFYSMPKAFMDVIGLAFDIEPLMFWTAIWSYKHNKDFVSLRSNHGVSVLGLPHLPLAPRFLHLGDGTCVQVIPQATIGGVQTNCFIIIVLTNTESSRRARAVLYDTNDRPHLHAQLEAWTFPETSFVRPSVLYRSALSRLTEPQLTSASHDPILFLPPLIHQHTAMFVTQTSFSEAKYQLQSDNNARREFDTLPNLWTELRDAIEQFELAIENCARFLKHYGRFEEEVFAGLRSNQDLALTRARRLEQQIRDYAQLEVGRLSLEESRKSIEASNTQIEEGKRVKLVTVLGFIFVPINLATSIFGMNIQELNYTGQRLWVFLVTTFAMVALVLFSWMASRKLLKMRDDYYDTQRNTGWEPEMESWATRLASIWWLLKKGRAIWMLRSKAFLALVTDGRVAMNGEWLTGYTDAPALYSRFPTSYIRDFRNIRNLDSAFPNTLSSAGTPGRRPTTTRFLSSFRMTTANNDHLRDGPTSSLAASTSVDIDVV
ncbi:hypothetical protein PV08_07286 [Exophiala spinifera]|uniref:Uncharacterized protein n=1 Tax=Exophiala spinifera TaxID=91928 RepID=A0A0D1ZP04_9EURO|nr:uncharacterized protein PV08_07286 [Exophiala spinifera]KIW14502.1 hypothetical protein PV08_07286 [Exophiala spinifera]